MGIGAGCISGIGATASVAGGTSDVGDFCDASGCGGCGGCGGYVRKCFLFKTIENVTDLSHVAYLEMMLHDCDINI